MLIVHSPAHWAHAPTHEFFRGERVPCFESPQRAEFVLQALRAADHEVREPTHDSRALLPRVHGARYLAFLESAWSQWLALDAANAARQPFPSVWPVRRLRSACARVVRHRPDALVVSLGLDTFAGDPISTFALQAGDFHDLGRQLCRLGCPTVLVLEGGYAAADLGDNAARVVDGFEQAR